MAITMNDATIDNTRREAIKSKDLGTYTTTFEVGSSDFAGISPEFSSKLGTAIGDFVTAINEQIDKINTETEATTTFKGTNLVTGINEFIEEVVVVAKSFASALEAAEKKVVEDVYSAYISQDQSLKADLGSEKTGLENDKIAVS